MALVLDTCVIIDCILAHRSRHSNAVKLARVLQAQGEVILVPASEFFEVTSAICCERKGTGSPPKLGELEDLPCAQQLIPIDSVFLRDYFFEPLNRGQLINLKGGDMIIVAVALKHGVPLVTEDREMAKVAQRLGVRVLSINEFLSAGSHKRQVE